MSVLLATHSLQASYGDFQALFDIDFEIAAGEIVAIIGANGAGKSTFLSALTGGVAVPNKSITYDGLAIGGTSTSSIVKRGIALVPEGRRLFTSLSVEENLLIGAYAGRTGFWNLERIMELFPALRELRKRNASTLSGGQQQMVAIARALMSNPKLLLCDEISLGLAPIIVKDMYAVLPRLVEKGLTLVIVEQDVGLAQEVSNRLYCLREGRVALHGVSSRITRSAISQAYFGV